MAKEVDCYGSQYPNFATDLYTEIRKEAFVNDIGQNGWLTADEHDLFIDWLKLGEGSHLLDVACGSGGPTVRIAQKTGCTVTGIDIHEDGIKIANAQAGSLAIQSTVRFQQVDASTTLPFEDASFDAIICIDAINHLPDRQNVLKEWHRILKPGGRLLFTDPITVTGILTKEDIELRASVGYFLFAADGVDEMLLRAAGFEIVKKQDRTENMAITARNWKNARDKHRTALIEIEGEQFEGQQAFLEICARLAERRDLSRFALLALKTLPLHVGSVEPEV